jgi:hypothetical protein
MFFQFFVRKKTLPGLPCAFCLLQAARVSAGKRCARFSQSTALEESRISSRVAPDTFLAFRFRENGPKSVRRPIVYIVSCGALAAVRLACGEKTKTAGLGNILHVPAGFCLCFSSKLRELSRNAYGIAKILLANAFQFSAVLYWFTFPAGTKIY